MKIPLRLLDSPLIIAFLGPMTRILIIASLCWSIAGCSGEKDNVAKDKIYYYTVTSPVDSVSDLVHFLRKNLNNKRVAITNGSGLAWPFYKVIEPNEDLPLDSLMPPHHFVHLLREKGDNKIAPQEYYIDIRVMIETGSQPSYELFIYKMTPTGLELTAKTGIHHLNASSFEDKASLYDLFLKSIIRYSFK